jgi:antirestriction protein ArdC
MSSGGGAVQAQGTPQNRLSRRTQAPRQLREGLSSGEKRTSLIRPINTVMERYIAEKIAAKDYVKAESLAKNKEYSPGGEWLVDSRKFLSLFTDDNGSQMSQSDIARLLGVQSSVIRDMGKEGNGVPESLFSDIAIAMHEGIVGQEGIGNLDPETMNSELNRILDSINALDYRDALGIKLWGFDYSPYWHDMTEQRTVTAIGQGDDGAEDAKRSFLAALEDNEVLGSFRPAFEPLNDEISLPIRVTPQANATDQAQIAPTANTGSLIQQSEILESRNFKYETLMNALGVDPDNRLAAMQKLVDEAIDVANAKTLDSWEKNGVPSEAIEHLIATGAIKSAADAFGPEFAEFDSMPSRAEVFERILSALNQSGLPESSIATITGRTYSLNKAKEAIAKAKDKKAKRIAKSEKFKPSGKASKVTKAEMQQMLNSFNVIAKKKGSPTLTMDQMFGNARAGFSSGGKRFVIQTPEKRITKARLEAKYPNLKGAYARISDIPTPERLNNTGLSSGREQDIYATITASLVESMEKAIANGIEWEAPWRSGRMFPRNGMTKTRYKGINTLMLMMAQEEKGYEKPIWGTFDNWKAAGGSVKKGEKGTPIIYAGYIKKEVDDPKNPGEKTEISRRTMKQYYVFNIDQVEGIDSARFDDGVAELDEQLRVADVDEVSKALGIDLTHAGDRAYFSPSQDKIVMPPFSEFKSPEDYYSVLMHEIVHWTGHSSRLDRQNMNQFGSPEYAFEELIAEIGAAYMMGILGLVVQPRNDHAHYLASWLKKLKDDPEAIQKAATAAQKSANYIIENVPSLKEATEKANKAAEEASEEAKRLSDEAKEARGSAGKSRKPSTRKPSTKKRQ